MTDNGFRKSPFLFARSLQELDLLAEQLPPISDSTSLSTYYNSSKFLLEKVVLFSNFIFLFKKLDYVVLNMNFKSEFILFNFFCICGILFGKFFFFFEPPTLQDFFHLGFRIPKTRWHRAHICSSVKIFNVWFTLYPSIWMISHLWSFNKTL